MRCAGVDDAEQRQTRCALHTTGPRRRDEQARFAARRIARSLRGASSESTDDRGDVESFQAIDARLRAAFRWLEKAITYLNGLKPPIEHRFDLGYGYVFDSPRFAHGSVGQHERRIVGFPVLEGIDVYYEVSAAKPLSIEVVPGWVSFAEKTLDAFGLQYTCRRVEDSDGTLRKCIFSVPPVIPARASFRVDYRTGIVTVALVNVDRLERVTLEFPSTAIDEPVLEDLVRLILGRDSAFLKRGDSPGCTVEPRVSARYEADEPNLDRSASQPWLSVIRDAWQGRPRPERDQPSSSPPSHSLLYGLRDEPRDDADPGALHRGECQAAFHRAVDRPVAGRRSICCTSPIAHRQSSR